MRKLWSGVLVSGGRTGYESTNHTCRDHDLMGSSLGLKGYPSVYRNSYEKLDSESKEQTFYSYYYCSGRNTLIVLLIDTIFTFREPCYPLETPNRL